MRCAGVIVDPEEGDVSTCHPSIRRESDSHPTKGPSRDLEPNDLATGHRRPLYPESSILAKHHSMRPLRGAESEFR